MGINYRVRNVRVRHPIRLSDASAAPADMSVEMDVVPREGVSIVTRGCQEGASLPQPAQSIETHTIRLVPSGEATGSSVALLPASAEGGTHFPASIDVNICLSPAQFDQILDLITGRMDLEDVLIEFDTRNALLTLVRLPHNNVTLTWALAGEDTGVQTVPVLGVELTYRLRSEAR